MDSKAPEWMQEMIPTLSSEFDKLCVEVHEAQEDTEQWLTEDTANGVLKTLAQLSNLTRYSYMRVRLLQEKLKREKTYSSEEDFTKDGD